MNLTADDSEIMNMRHQLLQMKENQHYAYYD